MNRRSTLATLMGKSNSSSEASPALAPLTGIDPYQGDWNYRRAAHLLRRTMFGPSYEQIKDAVDMGLEAVVSKLLEVKDLPDPPVNFNREDDPDVAIGESWVKAPYDNSIQGLQGSRRASLRGWTLGQMINGDINIREKMTLFWHSMLVTSEINEPRLEYQYITLLRENALGNFKELIKKITVNPSMLIYLNGTDSTNRAPNENYPRELLELFTLGKGDLAGPGDYTTFTEHDVTEMSKVLTGWVINRRPQPDPVTGEIEFEARFVPSRHDTTTKTLSHRFNNAVISNAGENEYSNLIDIIFEHPEASKFLVRKLYRWFVYYTITPEIEANVIEPLAELFKNSGYEVKPLVEALLLSEHFHDDEMTGCMIKNPLDFVAGMFHQFDIEVPETPLALQYGIWVNVNRITGPLQMEYYGVPSVAGWPAYYQEPGYYKMWINSVTLPLRIDISDGLSTVGFPIGRNFRLRIDALAFLETIEQPDDPNSVIAEFAKILFTHEVTDDQHKYLKEILIPGLPDYEWTVEYGEYKSDPQNSDLRESIELKVRSLLKAMLSMPEYQLS